MLLDTQFKYVWTKKRSQSPPRIDFSFGMKELKLLFFLFAFSSSIIVQDIKEISIEQTGCKTCGQFKVVYSREEKKNATYTGDEFSKMNGVWKGVVSTEQFDTLCNVLINNDFLNLNASYNGTDSSFPTIITGIGYVTEGGTHTKMVESRMNGGTFFGEQS